MVSFGVKKRLHISTTICLPPLTFHVPTEIRKSFFVVKSLYFKQISLIIDGDAENEDLYTILSHRARRF